MPEPIEISRSALIHAPAERVHAIVADYRDGHPHILPRRWFTGLEVLEGGTGAGTRIRAEMRVLGGRQAFEAVISEPVPGRRLVETIPRSGVETEFRFEPGLDPATTCVRIRTRIPARPGLAGRIERYLATRLLARVYRDELVLLDAFTRTLYGAGRAKPAALCGLDAAA